MDIEEPLTQSDQQRLEQLEEVIERSLQTFVEVGLALAAIKAQRLYRQTHSTFESYCQERWVLARRTAYQYIKAAEVVEDLCATAHILPQNENQTRPLSSLPAVQRCEAWSRAVDSSGGQQPTAAQVRDAVSAVREASEPPATEEDTADQADNLGDFWKRTYHWLRGASRCAPYRDR